MVDIVKNNYIGKGQIRYLWTKLTELIKKTGSCLGKVHFTYENGAVFVNFWVKRFSQVVLNKTDFNHNEFVENWGQSGIDFCNIALQMTATKRHDL